MSHNEPFMKLLNEPIYHGIIYDTINDIIRHDAIYDVFYKIIMIMRHDIICDIINDTYVMRSYII